MIDAHINSAASYHIPEKEGEMGQAASIVLLCQKVLLKTNTEKDLLDFVKKIHD